MRRQLEHEIFAEKIGCKVNEDRLAVIGVSDGNGNGAYSDSREFVIELPFAGNEKKFRLTDALKKRWNTEKIDFKVYVYLKDGKLTGGHIFKYKELRETFRNEMTGYETEPTQQEIRIANRILEYITEAELDETTHRQFKE